MGPHNQEVTVPLDTDAQGPARFPELQSRFILGMRVDATSYQDAADRVVHWAREGESRTLSASSVNNVIEARDDAAFLGAMNRMDLVTPDGMPLVWGLKLLGVTDASRTYGPTLTQALFGRAEREGIPVGLYGGHPDVLRELLDKISERWPRLEVAYHCSPPFRTLSMAEESEIVREINASGAKIIFIGLGAPKQDLWMDRQKGLVQAPMLGVGAAFDFIAGRKRQAPAMLQTLGLEWLFRLVTEPKRLWRRYLYRNPRFLVLFGAQVVRHRLRRGQHEERQS
jgi:N-acetylglucosaminyldiphosphoundecaprenol N-acetyl-beta-D-mannosaminyltransferase